MFIALTAGQNLRGANVIVSNTNDAGTGSLRQALLTANNGDNIVFDSGVTGTITLSAGQLVVDKNLTISGPGANILSVSGNNASRVFSIRPDITVTISGLTIENGNGVGDAGGSFFIPAAGGGIYNHNAILTVTYCTLRNNSTNNGGAIINDAAFGSGNASLILTNSTLSNNSAQNNGPGGAILNLGQQSAPYKASLTLTNCTLSSNSAASGGGILNSGSGGGNAETTLNWVTLSGSTGGGLYNDGSSSGTASLTLYSTLLNAGPSGANITNDSGTVSSADANLSSDNGSGFLTSFHDQINTDPKLGPLQDNGGPTFTHALLDGSPAIDHAPLNRPGDQRGLRRIGFGDVGAFEFQSLRTISITANGNDIVVAFHGVTPETYRLERKLSLLDPNWQSIPGVNDLAVNSNGTKTITDPNGLSLGAAYYRVRLVP